MSLLKRSLMLLMVAWLSMVTTYAQSDLQISKAFEQYGHRKGATLVELTNEALGDYGFSLFKSLTISNNTQAAEFVRQCLAKDEAGARKVKQVVVSGVATSIYLQLPKKGQLYRLILFNETRKTEQKVTLIYIESETDSEEILKFILKKK